MPQFKKTSDRVDLRTRGRGSREPLRIYRDPLPGARPGRRAKYPFGQLQVGECFYVPLDEVRSLVTLNSAARQWTIRNSKDWKFATGVVGDRIGVWRVA